MCCRARQGWQGWPHPNRAGVWWHPAPRRRQRGAARAARRTQPPRHVHQDRHSRNGDLRGSPRPQLARRAPEHCGGRRQRFAASKHALEFPTSPHDPDTSASRALAAPEPEGRLDLGYLTREELSQLTEILHRGEERMRSGVSGTRAGGPAGLSCNGSVGRQETECLTLCSSFTILRRRIQYQN